MLNVNGATIQRIGITQLFDSFSEKKIIFVSAPAGYGKTVAVRQWLDSKKCSKAFLSLDEYDNNILSFCERFCAALYACQPQNSALCEMISRPAFSGAPSEFTFRAIGTLSERKRAVFVMDDMHFLLDDGVKKLLLAFIQGLPKAIQLVLISRNTPPAELTSATAGDSPALIEADSLRFSKNDITRLYRKHGAHITPEESDGIMHFTGGWPIGVSALLLSGGKPSDNVLEYLDDFILPNIWKQLDDKTRWFMLCTAMARELNPSLCDALAETTHSDEILHGLVRAGAFVSRSKDGVFHYHHLFRSFLRNKVKERGDAFLYDLLEKEGNWHLSVQDFYSAAECFMRCENAHGIVKCFDMLEYADRNEFVIERMLPIIKSQSIQAAAEKYPSLFYLMSWAAFAEGRDKDMLRYMDSYYARYNEIAARDPSHAHNIVYMRIFDFRTSLLQIMEEAAQFPVITGVTGVQGSITMNMPTFHRGLCDFSEVATVDFEAFFASVGERIGWLFGEEWGIIYKSLVAGLLYEQGQLDKAHDYALCAVNEIKERFSSELKLCAMSILFLTLEGLGRLNKAAQVLQSISRMIENDRAYYLNRSLNALTARHNMSLYGAGPAQAWISGRTLATHEGAQVHSIYDALTTARAHIAVGDLEQAIILLSKLIDLARRFNRPLDIIEAQILLAASYWGGNPGFRSKAIDALAQAIALACPYGFMQPFINEQAGILGILPGLQGGAQWGDDDSGALSGFVDALRLRMSYKNHAALAETKMRHSISFSNRQSEVIALLCEGKSFKEIAETLDIKLSTVRSHIALIYDKLDASNKIDAISKIKMLGLID